jgi:hypothetical protein
MREIKYRLEMLRKELSGSIKSSKGYINKIALENFTDNLTQLDKLIEDLANDTKKDQNTLPIDGVVLSLKKAFSNLPEETDYYRKIDNGIVWKNK